MGVVLNYLQQYAYNVLMSGYNTFLTGDAGTGKTYVIKKFIDDARLKGRNVMVCAPTGIAALHVNGVTLHHQFRAKIGPNITRGIQPEALNKLIHTDILIIEEISMARIDLFDFVVNYIFAANSKRKIAGRPNIQLVLVGDFLQLPPVLTKQDKAILDEYYKRDIKAGFAFESEFWNLFNFKYIILTEVVRQDNKEFVTRLNKIRVGDKSDIQYIMDESSPIPLDNAISLYGQNNSAVEKNIEKLNELPTELYTFKAEIYGAAKITDTNAEETLALKVGARVMSLENKEDNESKDGTLLYGNGSLGTVVAINPGYITVEFDSGSIENIERHTWDIYQYSIDEKTKRDKFPKLIETQIGAVVQFPLKLAYAVTIHKSQGQTYNAVNISPYAWDCGQLYVALSRVVNIKNLYLKYSIDPQYLVISLNVIDFYNRICKEANKDVDTTVDLLEIKDEVYGDADMNKALDIFKNIG